MPSSDNWLPCRKGELRELIQGMHNPRSPFPRKGRLVSIPGFLVAVVLAASVARPYLSGRPQSSEISCEQVQDNLSRFASGEIDRQLADRILSHLNHCEACRDVYDELAASPEGIALHPNLEKMLAVFELNEPSKRVITASRCVYDGPPSPSLRASHFRRARRPIVHN
jgi:hypothetical protein